METMTAAVWVAMAQVNGPAVADVRTERVSVSDGTFAGVVAGQVASFKGIPFAAPLVGTLRWRAPQPPAKWSGVRLATAVGPSCLRAFVPSCLQQKNDLDGGAGLSEDCLTLNIWKRSGRQRHLPVMVWIYGGGFVVGSSESPFYDGALFARRGVILVSFNYRLGRLGFFAHPALDNGDGDEAVGNYGLMDQLAALRWVKAKFAAFGGDPATVTIFGESAGAISVNMLMTSPAGRALLAKTIAESGFGRNDPPDLAAAEAAGVTFAKVHDIDNGSGAAAALRSLPA